MPRMNKFVVAASLALNLSLFASLVLAQNVEHVENAGKLIQQPALARADAAEQTLLGASRAGRRLVAVGDHGTVLLSDDDGKTYRQARSVPTRATLTSVSFADADSGWAAGHWGVILHTTDGGETWSLQRSDTSVDQPLFSVLFSDAQHGVAVGLWSLVLVTSDGGESWREVALASPPGGGKADHNLYCLFTDGKGNVFAAAERGTVLRSADGGASWTYLNTGYTGSFWAGLALKDGTLLVGGLRGTIFRSTDSGHSWHRAASGTQSSITGILGVENMVHAIGLDGVLLRSGDQGQTFKREQRDDRVSLTASSLAADGSVKIYSLNGILSGVGAEGKADQPGLKHKN